MEFYHVLNRGVDKKDIVLDDGDRMRFVHSLYAFNDVKQVPNTITQQKVWSDMERKRDCLVKLHCWCLMNNHYHLLLSPADDDLAKLSLYMKKLNGGYAKFFNEKYERSGYLWQGKYKRVHIKQDAQFTYIPYYIHLNPLDISNKLWREGRIEDFDSASLHLNSYRWSSFQDYCGTKNFPSLLYTEELSRLLGDKDSQYKQIKRILSDSVLAANSNSLET